MIWSARHLARCIGASLATAERWTGPLGEAMQAYGITTPDRISAFLAQIGHESGGLRFTTELWGATAAQERYERDPDSGWVRGNKRNSLAFQLGNTEPGDGRRFCGHGLIQITGRYNHAQRRDRLRARLGDQVPDFEAQPELLAEPEWAALSAADYWDERGLNALADAGDFETITRRINGGLNGQADRLARWERAKAALAAEPLAMEPPPTPAPTPAPVQEPQPAPRSSAPAEPERSFSMSAFIPAAFAAIAEAVPSLIRLFGSSEVSERNASAAEIVVAAAKEATGARNEQELIETLKRDPAAAQLVQDAVQTIWYQIAVDSSGIDGARKANADAEGARPWLNPALWITVLLLPLVYMTVYFVMTNEKFSQDVKSMVVATVVSGVLSAVAGYWLGTSFSSSRKTELQSRK